jgi:hypothetical protein
MINISHGRRYITTIALVGFVIFGLFGTSLAAEEPTGLSNVTVWLYPEFDDPRLLVMTQGHVAQGTTLPAMVRFLVPTDAQLYSAGAMDSQMNYSGAPPQRQPSEIAGWDEISYDVTEQIFRVEYYTDAIKGETDKQIEFEYSFLYPVENLFVEVQQPLKATSFVITPTQESMTVGNDGLNYYARQIESLEAGEPVKVRMEYTKTDPALSYNLADQPQPAQSGPNADQTMLIVVTGGALVAILAAVFIISRRRRSAPAPSRAQRRARARQNRSRDQERPARSQVASEDTPSQAANFCRHCGTSLREDSLFCPQCGEQVT